MAAGWGCGATGSSSRWTRRDGARPLRTGRSGAAAAIPAEAVARRPRLEPGSQAAGRAAPGGGAGADRRRPEGDAILLTLRTPHLAAHAGQIAFPGGGIDPGDADPLAAALRETEEEIGLTRDRVEILGRLDTYVSRTGFEIQPFVGLLVPPFETAPDPFEVAEIFEVPLAFILAPGNPKLHRITVQGWSGSITLSLSRPLCLGVTAGILRNLRDVLLGPAP
jgi:8-oxo-dGTP pyrophosphatase MutT (NUDIX family)